MTTEVGKSAGAKPRGPLAGLRAFFSLRWFRVGNVVGARPARNTFRGPVQQELRLADVKPVCNDLSGADWEVVPPRKSAAKLAFLRNLALSGSAKAGRNRMTATLTGPSEI